MVTGPENAIRDSVHGPEEERRKTTRETDVPRRELGEGPRKTCVCSLKCGKVCYLNHDWPFPHPPPQDAGAVWAAEHPQ